MLERHPVNRINKLNSPINRNRMRCRFFGRFLGYRSQALTTAAAFYCQRLTGSCNLDDGPVKRGPRHGFEPRFTDPKAAVPPFELDLDSIRVRPSRASHAGWGLALHEDSHAVNTRRGPCGPERTRQYAHHPERNPLWTQWRSFTADSMQARRHG
jgi:hypothetical protein